MLVSNVKDYNQYNCKMKKGYVPSFKQVTPEHFFIRMNGYDKNLEWGRNIVNLVNEIKPDILNKNSNLKKVLYKIGKKYYKFEYEKLSIRKNKKYSKNIIIKFTQKFFMSTYQFLSGKSGMKKRFYNLDLVGLVRPDCIIKYGEYYDKIKQKLSENSNKLRHSKKIIFSKYIILGNSLPFPRIIKVNTWQVQEKFDGKKIFLTRMSYLPKKLNPTILCFIHPPITTRKPLLKHAQGVFETLKAYKSKNLNEKEIDEVYEKIGEIHWCLAQSMPFCHGSAGIADAFIKSLFESLNIQVSPWKEGLAPDIESFLTPISEFSKKYKTFFDNNKSK